MSPREYPKIPVYKPMSLPASFTAVLMFETVIYLGLLRDGKYSLIQLSHVPPLDMTWWMRRASDLIGLNRDLVYC